MAMTPMTPPEPDLETARVFLATFRQVFDFKEQQTTLRLFLAAQPRVPANQAPAGDINECCIICRDRLWPANVPGNGEDPVKLTCCAKYIDAACLRLWLSSSYDGGGNAHTCPFCRHGLIPAWPVRNAINGFIENEVDNPMAGFEPVDLPIRWVPKWVLVLGWAVTEDPEFVDIIYQTLGNIEHPREIGPGYAIRGRGTNVHVEQELLLDLGTWEEIP